MSGVNKIEVTDYAWLAALVCRRRKALLGSMHTTVIGHHN